MHTNSTHINEPVKGLCSHGDHCYKRTTLHHTNVGTNIIPQPECKK